MTNGKEMRDAAWRTSSYSTSGNQCVEVAPLPGGEVAVRDSKNHDAGVLVIRAHAWAAFTAALKNGDL